MDLLERMLGHDRWSTEKILELCQELSDAQLDQEFDIGHRSVRETLDHMIFVIDVWASQMQGRRPEHIRSPQENDRSIASLTERHDRYHSDFAAFARRAQDEHLLDDTFVDHYDFPQSIGATIIHVLHHNAQHRGEIRHILVRLGIAEQLDYDPQEWEYFTGKSANDQTNG
jgi:uncharacterized damage-inducible protein DinB